MEKKREKTNSFTELKNPPQYLVQKIVFTYTVLIPNFVKTRNYQRNHSKERKRER